MKLEMLDRDASLAEVIGILERDGCVIIRKLADTALMRAVRGEIEPYFERTPNGEGYFVGYRTKRMGALIVKSPACREIVQHPTVLGVMDHVLGPHCARYQLNLTQAIRIFPGEAAQVFHKDDELFPFERKGCQWMVNALWAYDDFTVENGATRVVPGSHVRPVDRQPAESDICYAEMPKGSVLLYLGSTLHSGGANRSGGVRTALTMSYSLGWLRQAENQYLAVPPDVARTLPKELQKLIGYAIHAPNLGWYEGQDPGVVLDAGFVDTLAAKDYMPAEIEAMLAEHNEAARRTAA